MTSGNCRGSRIDWTSRKGLLVLPAETLAVAISARLASSSPISAVAGGAATARSHISGLALGLNAGRIARSQ
jgi:hypothetical protein